MRDGQVLGYTLYATYVIAVVFFPIEEPSVPGATADIVGR
jgi:hypothetical protein